MERKNEESDVEISAPDIKMAGLPNTMANMFRAIVGSGILGLPWGFYMGGWLLGVIAFPIIAVFCGYCNYSLIACKVYTKLPRTTIMSDVVKVGFGNVGARVLDGILTVDVFFLCWTYSMFTSNNLELVTHIRQEIWVGAILAVFFILSFIRPIKFIGYFSLFANFCTFLGMAILLIAIFVAVEPKGKAQAFNWKEFPVFFGIVLFAFQALELAIPIHNAMREQRKYPLAMVTVLAFVCFLYVVFGVVVYLRLRDNTLEIITEAITAKRFLPLRLTISSLFIASVAVNLMMYLFPLYELVDTLFCVNRFRHVTRKALDGPVCKKEDRDGRDARDAQGSNSKGTTGVEEEEGEEKEKEGKKKMMKKIKKKKAWVRVSDAEEGMDHYLFASSFSPPPPLYMSSSSSSPPSFSSASSSSSSSSGGGVGVDVGMEEKKGKEKEEGEKETGEATAVGAEQRNPGNSKFWVLTITGRVLVLLVVAVPSATPIRHRFTSVMSLSGGTTGMLISFVIPLVLHLRLMWKVLPKWQRALDMVCMGLCIPAGVYITVITIISVVADLGGSG